MSVVDLQAANGVGWLSVATTGVPGDPATAELRLIAHGPRGAAKATALYLPHNAPQVRRLVREAGLLLSRRVERTTIAFGGGFVRMRVIGDAVSAEFRGARGGALWLGSFPAVASGDEATADAVVRALDQGGAHLAPVATPTPESPQEGS